MRDADLLNINGHKHCSQFANKRLFFSDESHYTDSYSTRKSEKLQVMGYE